MARNVSERNISRRTNPTTRGRSNNLGEHARQQHEIIVKGERDLAPAYWELGWPSRSRSDSSAAATGESSWPRTASIAFVLAVRGRFFGATQRRRRLPTSTVQKPTNAALHVRCMSPSERQVNGPGRPVGPWLPREKTEAGLQAYLVNVQQGADEFVDVAASWNVTAGRRCSRRIGRRGAAAVSRPGAWCRRRTPHRRRIRHDFADCGEKKVDVTRLAWSLSPCRLKPGGKTILKAFPSSGPKGWSESRHVEGMVYR